MMPNDTTSRLGSSSRCTRNILKVNKKVFNWTAWHKNLQKELAWVNADSSRLSKYVVFLSAANLDRPISIYERQKTLWCGWKNRGCIKTGSAANPFGPFCTREKGARTFYEGRQNKITRRKDAVFFSQVLAENNFWWRRCFYPEVKAQAVWMKLSCFPKMSKSLLICVLETVPKTSRLIPSHTSVYIPVVDAAGGSFLLQCNKKNSKNTEAPWGGGGVPHCEEQPLVEVVLADPAGNKDGSPGL